MTDFSIQTFRETFKQSGDSTDRLLKVLERTLQALEQQGVQLSVNIQELMDKVSSDRQSVEVNSKQLIERLEQSQELVRTAALITSSLDLDQVLEDVMDTVINLTGAERAYLMLRDAENEELTIRAARNWDRETLPEDDVIFSRGVVQIAIEEAEPILSTNAQEDPRFQAMRSVFRHDLRSILCLPLMLHGQSVGVLYADNRIEQGAFRQDIVPLMRGFASQAAIAIDNARLFERVRIETGFERELQIGQQIQAGFLPSEMPQASGWEIEPFFKPARQVAGDFYDAFTLSRNRVGFVVGDVTDKGVGAALFMTLVRSLIRAFAQQHYSSSFVDVLADVGSASSHGSTAEERRSFLSAGMTALKNAVQLTNNYVANNHSESNMFATMFFGLIDPNSGTLVYINAGQNPPVIASADGTVKEELQLTGPAVGLMPDMEFQIEHSVLESGDILLAYTDGLPEAKAPDGAFFSEERLLSLLKEPVSSAVELVKRIEANVDQHIGDANPFDDITMIVVRRASDAD
jgi:sigma-B regulation protein RsbU (phosphoserine phosphatase)